MNLVPNWKNIAARSHSMWAFYLSAICLAMPDVIYLTLERDTDPRNWSIAGFILLVYGIFGRLVNQGVDDGSKPRARGVLKWIAIAAGILLFCASCEEGGAEYTSEITFVDDDNRYYTVDDASGFAVNDIVYVIPSYDPQVGDYEWCILNPATGTNANGLNFCSVATYRNLLQWSGMVMAMRYLGFMPTDSEYEAWQGYVAFANEADVPSADEDYPQHHSTFHVGWADTGTSADRRHDRDMWGDHWASTISLVADAT